jgi:glycosidase
MAVPYWVQDAIFYQIFPDRFANGDPHNDPPNVQPWGSPPNLWGFQGGDLRGVIEKLDYLIDLGVNALYLNPIFLSPANHHYSTTDYYKIDPRLGDQRDFKALLDAAHANGVRVVLDGVFNHCSRGFFAFSDLLENQDHSAYKDWFHIKRFPVDAYTPGKAENFTGWWGYKSLPKFNTANPAVRKYLINVGRHWIEQGADGWRLDVPNEIDDDAFWADFRRAVKDANPDAYIVGEIWTAEPRWVGPDHFDGLMNYPVRDALIEMLGAGLSNVSAFADRVEKLLSLYPRENVYAMYVPLGSHDTERLRTALGGEAYKVRLAYTFLFAYPGAPAVYYGDEIGLAGGKDPESRAAFPWNRASWDAGLHDLVRSLAAIRRRMPALRRGDFKRLLVDDRRRVYAFARRLSDQVVIAALNFGPTGRSLRIPIAGLGLEDGRILRNLLGTDETIVSGHELVLELPPWSGAWVG